VLNSKAYDEDLCIDFFKINSMLEGYTQWVHLRCTQWNCKYLKLDDELISKNREPLNRLFQSQLKDWGLVGDGYPLGPLEGENFARGHMAVAPL
jgi:hypothetical protein